MDRERVVTVSISLRVWSTASLKECQQKVSCVFGRRPILAYRKLYMVFSKSLVRLVCYFRGLNDIRHLQYESLDYPVNEKNAGKKCSEVMVLSMQKILTIDLKESNRAWGISVRRAST